MLAGSHAAAIQARVGKRLPQQPRQDGVPASAAR
jgi:hypothetical protein